MGWLSQPMPWITLGQMRRSGSRMVEATCLACGHRDAVAVDSLPDEMPIPYVADRLRCSECRSKKIETKAAFLPTAPARMEGGVPRYPSDPTPAGSDVG